jgi:DnaD/phage-associated family protein
MAKYRQVHVDFWQDGFVLDLTPEEKYFYIYLMTNSKTSQCGIYELPKRIIETETGYNRETVDKLLNRFVGYKKILYDESAKEIMLLNWVKYNSIKSPKTQACIEKELTTVKNKQFISTFDSLCKEYGYPINTPYIYLGEEQEKEEEEEQEEEQEQQQEKEVVAVDFYQQNFGMLSPIIGENICKWVDDFNNPIVVEAMTRAKKQQKSWSYAEGILKNWMNRNVKTIKDIIALDAEFKNKHSTNKKSLFEQGEESKKRQSQPYKSKSTLSDDELPY